MRIEERQPTATAEQILGEIRDFCRATQTAESTFGRLVVNDGKLVSRLRDGAKITTGTLDKVRAYLSEHHGAPPSAQSQSSPAVKLMNGAQAWPTTLIGRSAGAVAARIIKTAPIMTGRFSLCG